MKGDFYRHLVQVGDNEVRKAATESKKRNHKFKAMINIKENVICLGY
jgi:purine-nucleoside phosphorylase